MSGVFSSVGPIHPNMIGFDVAATRLKSASIKFENTPGELVLEDKWFRDKATMQVTSASPNSIVGELRKLSGAAGLPFHVEDVTMSKAIYSPESLLDLREGASLEAIAEEGRSLRDKPAVEAGQEFYIASLSVHVMSAAYTMQELVRTRGNNLRFIEVEDKSGGESGFYQRATDNPHNILSTILQGSSRPKK
ncbi:hypothetical protein IV102_25790 [bacterium]|nr:hypothetical protein [bacterium]